MAATGVINFHRTSPQPTACRYPTCSLTTATGSNKDPRQGLNLLRWLVVISCFTLLTIFFYPSIPVSFYLYFPSLFSFLFQVFILLFILTFSLLISFLSSTKQFLSSTPKWDLIITLSFFTEPSSPVKFLSDLVYSFFNLHC